MLLGTQQINEEGQLVIGGCEAGELAHQFGTPLFVMDETMIRDNCRRYTAAFAARYPGATEVCYAGKAFLVAAMALLVEQEGLSLDVASAGELYTALHAEFPARRILLHGNNKSDEELEAAVSAHVGRIVVDNLQELHRLQAIAVAEGRVQPILLRVTPGIDPHTHRRIRTGQQDTKFGFNIQDGAALEAIQQALAMDHLHLLGLHCHIGSQLLDPCTHQQAIEIVVDFLATVRQKTGRMFSELNLGGGLGVRYTESQPTPPTIEQFADAICGTLVTCLARHGLTPPRLLVEPGRSLVAEAGATLYTVGAIKRVHIPVEPGERTYVSVDGGMSDNPRPQLYDATYSAMIANRACQSRDQVVTVAGKHCETDILIWDIPLGRVEAGDILAVQTTGAYNHAMASNYNRFLRPAVVFVHDGHAEVVYARETLIDLVSHDRIPARLHTRFVDRSLK